MYTPSSAVSLNFTAASKFAASSAASSKFTVSSVTSLTASSTSLAASLTASSAASSTTSLAVSSMASSAASSAVASNFATSSVITLSANFTLDEKWNLLFNINDSLEISMEDFEENWWSLVSNIWTQWNSYKLENGNYWKVFACRFT